MLGQHHRSEQIAGQPPHVDRRRQQKAETVPGDGSGYAGVFLQLPDGELPAGLHARRTGQLRQQTGYDALHLFRSPATVQGPRFGSGNLRFDPEMVEGGRNADEGGRGRLYQRYHRYRPGRLQLQPAAGSAVRRRLDDRHYRRQRTRSAVHEIHPESQLRLAGKQDRQPAESDQHSGIRQLLPQCRKEPGGNHGLALCPGCCSERG